MHSSSSCISVKQMEFICNFCTCLDECSINNTVRYIFHNSRAQVSGCILLAAALSSLRGLITLPVLYKTKLGTFWLNHRVEFVSWYCYVYILLHGYFYSENQLVSLAVKDDASDVEIQTFVMYYGAFSTYHFINGSRWSLRYLTMLIIQVLKHKIS